MARGDFWFAHRLRVRFVEVDPFGVVHNSQYLVYFGIALHEYFRALSYDRFNAPGAADTGLYVVEAQIQYRQALRFDDEAEVCARIARIGRSSLTFDYEIYKAGTDPLVANGKQTWVNVHRASGKSAPWDPALIALVERAEGQRLART